jgi:hypothetical protein
MLLLLLLQAGDVARLRAEISALADRLAGRPVRQLSMGGHDAPMAAVAVKSAHVRARSKTEDLAFRAYEMVRGDWATALAAARLCSCDCRGTL